MRGAKNLFTCLLTLILCIPGNLEMFDSILLTHDWQVIPFMVIFDVASSCSKRGDVKKSPVGLKGGSVSFVICDSS